MIGTVVVAAAPPVPRCRSSRRVFASLLAVVQWGIPACHPPAPEVSGLATGEARLGPLRGIALGAAMEAVQALRPLARSMPYTGLVEAFGEDTVIYRVEPGSNLRAVELLSRYPSDSLASAAWWRQIELLTRQHGPLQQCLTVAGPPSPKWSAVWRTDGVELTAEFSPAWVAPSRITGDLSIPATTRLVIAQPVKPSHPEFSREVPVSCATLPARAATAP